MEYIYQVKATKRFTKGPLKGLTVFDNFCPFCTIEDCWNWIDIITYKCLWTDDLDFELMSAEIINTPTGKTIARAVNKML